MVLVSVPKHGKLFYAHLPQPGMVGKIDIPFRFSVLNRARVSNPQRHSYTQTLVKIKINKYTLFPFMTLRPGRIGIWKCWFLWREENRSTRRKTLGARTRTNNKLNPHMTPGLGIEPGPHSWKASALTTAPFLPPPPPRGARGHKSGATLQNLD